MDTVKSDDDDIDERSEKNKVIEIKSIDSLIRYAVIVFIGFLSTLLVFIHSIINFITGYSIGGGNDDDEYHLGYLVLTMDIMINMLCIYLLFGFGEKLYYKLCICCDKCLKNCFVKRMLNKRVGVDHQLTLQQSKALLFKTI